jgi:D-threo-aldose 1-dehydrogenase
MEIRQLHTRNGANLAFSVIGQGTGPLGDFYELLDERMTIETVETAYKSGIRVFDSSPHYGNGLAESRMGAGLRRAPRDEIVVSTKIGRVMNPFQKPPPPRTDVASPGFAGGFPHTPRFDYSYDGTMRSVEHSLLRTGLSRLDVLLIHDCDVWTHGKDEAGPRFKEAMEGAYKALDKLRAEKTVNAIGFGINEADTCVKFARAGDFDVAMMAGRYTLLDQTGLTEFLPLALEKKIGVMMAGVFNSGILATSAVAGAHFEYGPAPAAILDRVRKIDAICAAHNVSLRTAALHFAMSHPATLSVVLGAVRPSEAAANAADADRKPPAALWGDLKTAGLIDKAAPTPEK